jgi:hypothetical protein
MLFCSNPWIGGKIQLILNSANLVDGKVQWEIEYSHGERLKVEAYWSLMLWSREFKC